MPVQFILGRAGTGKTRHCFDAIKQWVKDHGLKSKVFFLLPHQATFIAERQLAAGHSGASLLGVRVVSFDSLAREVAEAGIAESAMVDGLSRRLLVAMAVQKCAPELRYFHGAERQPHLPGRLDAAITETEQSQHAIDEIAQLAAPDSPTRAKLQDLTRIRAEYDRLLTDQRLDSARQQQRLLDRIRHSSLLEGALVVVDGFAGFSRIQRDILVALAARAAQIDIGLLLDREPSAAPDELDLFHRTATTYLQLRADLEKAGVRCACHQLPPAGHRFTNAPLRNIERAFAGETPASPTGTDIPVTLIEATSELEEVKAAARQIRQWVRDHDLRFRDIGVLCRNLSTYGPWITPVFAEHGISCFLDQRRSLSHHPLLRMVRGMLEIVTCGWKQQLVLDYLKCGLVPLQADELDLFENFVLRHGITGDGWLADWDFLSCPASEDDTPDDKRERHEAALCQQYRPRSFDILTKIQTLAQTGTMPVATFVDALLETVISERSQPCRMLRSWIAAAPPEEAQEHEQCRSQLAAVLESMKRLLGEQQLPFAEAAAVLLTAMESLEAKLTPPTLDQVLVGQVDRSRSPEFACVILLGMNEGVFPAGFAEDSIFSDAERQRMREAGIELEPDSRRKTLDERLLAYVALTRASRAMVLCRAIADEEGRERSPSRIISMVRAAAPVREYRVGGSMLDEAGTPAQLAAIVGAWKREGDSQDIAFRQAYACLASAHAHPDCQTAWAAAKKGLTYTNTPSLSPLDIKAVLGDTLSCSVTRLEHFTQCPFRHLANDILRLREREIAEVSDLDLGNAFHSVLDRLGKQAIVDRLDWSRAAMAKHLDSMLEDVSRELHNEVLLSSARNQYLTSVIRRMLDRVVDDQEKIAQASSYRIAHTELSFGSDGDTLAAVDLTTPKGRRVRLRGRIDRIDSDRDQKGAQSYLIFDYKRHGKRLNLSDAQRGLELQLLTYILALRSGGMAADGAMYVPLMRAMETRSSFEPADQDGGIPSKERPRGLVNQSALERLQPGLKGASKLFTAATNADGSPRAGSDCIPDGRMDDIEKAVHLMLGKIADDIFDGNISVTPYQLGKRTPCPFCEFHRVCRMDHSSNRYREPKPIVPLVPEKSPQSAGAGRKHA